MVELMVVSSGFGAPHVPATGAPYVPATGALILITKEQRIDPAAARPEPRRLS
jgi:hypothetical protein